jgi:hypothetical protein
MVVGILAFWIGSMQARIQDSVELYASFGIMKDIGTNQETPIIHIQNIGTRVIYFDSYEFNGRIYELGGQVRPPTYSGAINSFYRIDLPTNGETHVSLFINFHDVDNRKWRSKVICDLQDGWWNIKTYPSERTK